MSALVTAWQYVHQHWQDNMIAGLLIPIVPGYFWGHRHIVKLHKRLDYQDAQHALMHKHVKQIRDRGQS